MNGRSAASSGNIESRLAHRLRDLSDRLRAVETRRPKSISIGSWTLSENDQGDLVAANANGALRVIARAQLVALDGARNG